VYEYNKVDYCNLELLEIDFKLLGRGINAAHFVNGLDSLGADTKTNITLQVFGKESLPLQVDVLDLLDTLVRKGNDASLTVGCLAQQVADACPHDEAVGASRTTSL
jgi:hypothetical protein